MHIYQYLDDMRDAYKYHFSDVLYKKNYRYKILWVGHETRENLKLVKVTEWELTTYVKEIRYPYFPSNL